MPQFSYTAVKRGGEKVSGMLDAPSELEVRMTLRAQQLRPVKITQAGALEFDLAKMPVFGGGVKSADVILFTRQLSILISSGVPLVQGLDAIATQLQNERMKNIVLSIKEKVTGGSFLWEAMKGYPKVFSNLYVSMIRAGEAAGALDAILKRLIKYLDDAEKLKKMVKGAMIYPISITVVGIVVVIVMMTFVIPKFEAMLEGVGQELPAITQAVIDASHFVTKNIMFILGGLGATVVFLRQYLSTEEGRNFFDHWILSVPVFGPIVHKVSLARFARTMQTLITSGVGLLDAFDICKEAIGNQSLVAGVGKMRIDIEGGKTMSSAMQKNTIFPSMVVQMISVGETTGNLDKMLERVAEFYEEDVQNVVANLSKLVEPFIMVFLGGLVGGLMLAMYMPIFQMAGGAG